MLNYLVAYYHDSILSDLEKLNKIITELQSACQETLTHTQEIIAKEKEKEEQITQCYNVFVYCGGKCGSSTLQNTFSKNNYQSIHLHGYMKYTVNNITYDIYDLINVSSRKYETIYLIDSYRTPIERKLSSFFQNIHFHLPNYTNFKLSELIDWFNTNCLYYIEEYHSINQLLTQYQLPLFTTFDFEKGYNLIKKTTKYLLKFCLKILTNGRLF